MRDDATPLWRPSAGQLAAAAMTKFRLDVAARHGVDLPDSAALHRFSIDRPGEFWSALWDFAGVVGDRGDRAFVPGKHMRDARFFPDATLNVVDTLLAARGDAPAILAVREDGERSVLSWDELRAQVGAAADGLRAVGVESGDVVAAWLPNIPQAFVTALAAASIGAVYTSTSPDFGVTGVLDRFGQVKPKVLVAADGYVYAGKAHDCLARLREIRAGLPSLKRVVVVPYLADAPALRGVPNSVLWDKFLQDGGSLAATPLPFDAPLFVLYSSGTTGAPKCIVHRAGGLLLSLLKEHRLHCDIRPGDRVFYYTTTGWMMWNWLLGALAAKAALVVYDGSPVHPASNSLFDLADELGITLFGTSAKYIDTLRKTHVAPSTQHELSALRTITSTGSPLSAENFDYVYEHVKKDVHLASISGGTDICGCFVMGDPTRPVYRGEIQGPSLGMAVDVFDDEGKPAPVGVTGELVCTAPFPSMPLGFWADDDGSRYQAAYFSDFPGVWRHGDWLARTEHGGFVITGRSDATLNPGGVRIGTAEIYRQVELFPEVAESVVIGQDFRDDVRVVLFVKLADGHQLSDDLAARIKSAIRANCSPRHVPALIVAVPDVPRTRSGKLVELAVRDVVHGQPVRNTEALANPESLEHFRGLPQLR
ncbi:MAG TPA: acetoacetate--CoA ligase [Acidothermaceae bacterium]|nr:acetoacetate--CoA ligase [Acidothermaceae bacterium]